MSEFQMMSMLCHYFVTIIHYNSPLFPTNQVEAMASSVNLDEEEGEPLYSLFQQLKCTHPKHQDPSLSGTERIGCQPAANNYIDIAVIPG